MMQYLVLKSILAIIACQLCRSEYVEEEQPRVITPLGTIEGFYETSSEGRLYEAYLGIPYAEPITNERRFETAKPVAPWTGVLSAKTFGPWCMQVTILSLISTNPTVSGSEDCLYLNVYTPTRRSRKNAKPLTSSLPVIIFIHGGGFQFGSGADWGPDYLLDERVIFVTINYRLGPLGFLSTEDENISGNMGLKDQVVAMRWVKDNVIHFGGDPEKITIVGQSAGGLSVHLHYLSNLTEGLFQRGMSLSANALDSWGQSERNLEKAKELATIVGCPSAVVREMVNCLKAKPAESIALATVPFTPWLNTPVTPFGPVVETGKSNFTFIDQQPIDLMISGRTHDLPWINSAVGAEGLAPSALFVANASLLEELNDKWDELAPFLLDYNDTIPESQRDDVSRLIREHYFGTSPIDGSTVDRIIDAVGDRLFNSQAEKAAKLQAAIMKSPVRFYYFTYRGAHSLSEFYTGTNTDYGAMHIDDIIYVMKSTFDPTTTQRDREVQKAMVKLWVSFARDGVPDLGVEWPRLDPGLDGLQYLQIAGPDNIAMNESLYFGNKNFWRSIPFRKNIPSSENERKQHYRVIDLPKF